MVKGGEGERVDRYLLLASDGFWDVWSNTDVYKEINSLVYEGKNMKDIAKILTNGALKRGSQDNISVVVVDLKVVFEHKRYILGK